MTSEKMDVIKREKSTVRETEGDPQKKIQSFEYFETRLGTKTNATQFVNVFIRKKSVSDTVSFYYYFFIYTTQCYIISYL